MEAMMDEWVLLSYVEVIREQRISLLTLHLIKYYWIFFCPSRIAALSGIKPICRI
jgi:hypothetical protein